MPYAFCRHVRTNGRRCQAPALKEDCWCYFHAKLHLRHRAVRPAQNVAGTVDLPPLEDRDSIQMALSLVVGALAGGKLDEARARALFHGLNLASRNALTLLTGPTSDYRVSTYLATLDGLALAQHASSDGSSAPAEPEPAPRPVPRPDTSKSTARPE